MSRDRARRVGSGDAGPAGAPSRRSERVASEIQRVLGQVLLRDVADPRAGAANITRVRVTPDLRNARIYFALFSQEEGAAEQAVAALTHASPFLRRQLARELGLRFTPNLSFFYDEELDDARRIDSLLRTLTDEPAE